MQDNFIPFEKIAKPNMNTRRDQYMRRLEDDNLKNDSKLQARLGMKPSTFNPDQPAIKKK